LNTIKKIRIAVISFVLVLVISAGVLPFAGATYTERDKIIDIALNEVGYLQQNGYNKYSAEFGNGYTAWCNYFVVWCAKQAGISPEAITGTSSYNGNCYIYMSALMSQGRFFENDGSYTPVKGDLVFYNSSRSTSGSTHVGFVLSANESTVEVVEGNVGVGNTRGVAKKVRPRYSFITDDMVIIGFGVPAYSGEEIPKVELKKTVNRYPETKKVKEVKKEKKFSIDAKKFETQLSPDERIKIQENFSVTTENTHESFVAIISPTPIVQNKIEKICEKDFCICSNDK